MQHDGRPQNNADRLQPESSSTRNKHYTEVVDYHRGGQSSRGGTLSVTACKASSRIQHLVGDQQHREVKDGPGYSTEHRFCVQHECSTLIPASVLSVSEPPREVELSLGSTFCIAQKFPAIVLRYNVSLPEDPTKPCLS